MKTARERAEELVSSMVLPADAGYEPAVLRVRLSLMEFARDQRHRCVEALNDAYSEVDEDAVADVDAQAVVHNTPLPGE